MKQNKKTFSSKFERLIEAVENDSLFDDENEDIVDDYEDNIDEIGDEEGEMGEEVTITLSQDQVSVLRDILSQVEGGDEEEGEEDGDEFDAFDDEGMDDVSDIEEIEKEAVESENAPDPESARNRTKSGKASTKTGDLDKETNSQDGEEKQYKFVKREKPTEKKYKTTKGS